MNTLVHTGGLHEKSRRCLSPECKKWFVFLPWHEDIRKMFCAKCCKKLKEEEAELIYQKVNKNNDEDLFT